MIGVGLLNAMHCVICGATDYTLSCGGPTICPKCDCGNFDAATVDMQAKVISALRKEIEDIRAHPQSLSGCLHPGKEPNSCQYEAQCLSVSCNHHGKTWYGPRMTLEAQKPGILYPKERLR